MKRLLSLTMLVVLCIMCACQPTPQNDFVVQQNEQSMIEQASKSTTESATKESDTPSLFQRNITSPGGNLSVIANANVIIPDNPIPIIRVQHIEFTEDQVKQIAAVLFGENAKYVSSDSSKTQAMYLETIEHLKNGIDNWDLYGKYVYDEYETREAAEFALNHLYEEMSNAPQSLNSIEPGYEFDVAYSSKGRSISSLTVLASQEDKDFSRLNVFNSLLSGCVELDYCRNVNWLLPGYTNFKDPQSPQTCPQDIYVIARDALDSMGLSDFDMSTAYLTKQYYRNIDMDKSQDFKSMWQLVFTRSIEGVTTIYTNKESLFLTDDSYSIPWQEEQITITIDDEGIFYFRYVGPLSIQESEVESCNIKPFSEIADIFDKWIGFYHNDADTYHYDQCDYISTVQLGLISIQRENSSAGVDGLLVPVWAFIGTQTINGKETETNGRHLFLMINAVDGSIINFDD